jgi:Tol biopolymer transport system component
MADKVDDRLESWKAIADYLDHNPATVMRWAKERGLPVYTVPGEGQRRRAVYAYKGEIDAWLKKPATAGSHVDERKAQSGIPRSARNDSQPLRELADGGSAARQNDQHNRGVHPEEAQAEGLSEKAAPQGSGASAVAPNAHASSSSSRPGTGRSAGISDSKTAPSNWFATRWGLWAVLLAGALLIALAAAAWIRGPSPEPKVLGFEQLTNDGLEKRFGLVTDGARVYFIENSRDGFVLAEIPKTGGDPVTIARTNPSAEIQDIRPDRSELLLIEDVRSGPGSVWILRLPTGSGRRLGNIQAFSAAWSPDGAVLAYTTDDGVYLCDPEGTNSRKIAAMSGKLSEVHWSPDGRQLCFRRAVSNEAKLWVVDREGKGLRLLLPDWDIPRDDVPFFWTPDGKFFIFQANHTGHVAPCVAQLSRGLLRGNQRVTCLGPAGLELRPAATSPDGSRLYCFGSTRGRSQIERFDARSKAFGPLLPDVRASALDFTKDGQWIAYVDEAGQLWKNRNGGGEKVQLTLPPLDVELPRWSPDGQWIAFMGQDPSQPWKVRVVSAEGGPYGPLTSTDAAEGAPTWSPDGSRLLFGGLVNPADKTPGPLVIHIFDMKERRLSVVPGSEGLWTSRWSPDGHYIAALTEDSRNLILFDLRSGKRTRLATLGLIWDLQWSRHGESIYLDAETAKGEPALFRVKIVGHQPERLTGVMSCGWLGLAPDDSPLVARPVTSGEIYALQCQLP